MKTVTKENQENVREFFSHVSLKDSKGNPVRCRRNGATKIWKTRPDEFRIPVIYGLYEYFYIDQNNAKDWEVES